MFDKWKYCTSCNLCSAHAHEGYSRLFVRVSVCLLPLSCQPTMCVQQIEVASQVFAELQMLTDFVKELSFPQKSLKLPTWQVCLTTLPTSVNCK